MSHAVWVVGVGMTPFVKPGASEPYDQMGARAARAALEDAGVPYDRIGQAYAGYVFGDSTCGQAALYRVGLTGVPVVNVNNNCSTGSTALFLARQAVAGGAVECALALGFEQMAPGALTVGFGDRPNPLGRLDEAMERIQGIVPGVPFAAQYFGGAGREHQARYGTRPETFAAIAVKARRHAAHNPNALFRTPLTVEEVLASPPVFAPLTRFQCCPPTCGAAAALVCSEAFARRHGVARRVRIAAQALVTDREEAFSQGMMALIGCGMTREAAGQVYEAAGLGPREVDVVELHDCFTANELVSYEALGLVADGGAERFVADGDNTYGGRVVTNPSGGLLAKGHPLGATGLAQCAELTWQLRGEAGGRQVPGARVGLQHNIGLGGACVVTLYRSG